MIKSITDFTKLRQKLCSCRCEIRQLSCPGPSFHHRIIAGPTSSRNITPSKFKIHKTHREYQTSKVALLMVLPTSWFTNIFQTLLSTLISYKFKILTPIRDQLFMTKNPSFGPREVRQKLSIKFKSGRTSWRRTRRKTTQACRVWLHAPFYGCFFLLLFLFVEGW